jgi:rod shape-determining protein MreD
MNPTRGGWFIGLTLFVALVLSVVHLPATWPEWLEWLRPHWAALFVFFWVLHFPHRLGLLWAWFIGLLLDVLRADPFGLNALTLAAVTFITWKLYERLRMYTVLQQCAVVLLLVFAAEALRFVVHGLWLDRETSPLVAVSALMSAIVWPPVDAVFRRLAAQFHVRERT